MDLELRLGLNADPAFYSKLTRYINLKFAYMGLPTIGGTHSAELVELASPMLSHQQEIDRLVADHLCATDQRIQDFLNSYLAETKVQVKLPSRTFILDRYGLARVLSLPPDKDEFVSDIVRSYRVKQGVLHNPKSDRRTTEGIFHVSEGGLPIPDDKKAVPVHTFAALLQAALKPPSELLQLPFAETGTKPAETFVSLYIRPIVSPAVGTVSAEKSLEIRFFVPGNLVGNLDFVESIFGNAGDPYLPENDAALDVEHWSGHTGCVILAPHLIKLTKKAVGLPHFDDATERQKRDRMCWRNEDELYNEGGAFKVTGRDARGVIVTVIADNYFGYCKKEVKTQISFAANLGGYSEEEHAGGALVYPSYDLGDEFSAEIYALGQDYSFKEVVERYGAAMHLQPEGYGIDKTHPEIIYVPEDAHFSLLTQRVSWMHEGAAQHIKLLPKKAYVRPSGFKVRMQKVPGLLAWRLVGTMAEGTLCHKPCTVSGGGKSEISKPLTDAILQGPVFVADFQRDFDRVAELIERNYGDRFADTSWHKDDSRSILSTERSLGSVIKLLTPTRRDYSASYNEWLETIPQNIKDLVYVVKRCYRSEWGANWRDHFSVDIINGTPGNELRCDGRKLVASYLRVGYDQDGSWRTFGLRPDFQAAAKVSQEDDISASTVVPADQLVNLNPDYSGQSHFKFVVNCEYRLFQRPDDAIVRGYDKQTESDFVRFGNFLSNYQPLTTEDATDLVEDSIGFESFTPPMQAFIFDIAKSGAPCFFVSSAHPRIVDGKPTKNPRYLQTRPDLVEVSRTHLAAMSTRMHRRISLEQPLYQPVNAVLPGRRNNPPEPGVRPLAVFNPVHYMETPELFMEFISSMTGKSPSTTGAGSEGALTKGPFNALPPIFDLNNAYVAHILTGANAFLTAAGYVGPHLRVDHDVSLLVPEIWSRMSVEERDPRFLIENAYLEKCEDFEYGEGSERRTVLTSRLGYRITRRFVRAFFGRVFNHPQKVFTDEMLRPERQDLAVIVDGMDNIVTTHKRVAQLYFNDGSVDMACPPLYAVLHIMRDDHFQGKRLDHPDIRALFTREALLESPWYAEHLAATRAGEVRLWQRHIEYLEKFLRRESHQSEALRLGIYDRLELAKRKLSELA